MSAVGDEFQEAQDKSVENPNDEAANNPMQALEDQEKKQKDKLNEMKKAEYHWYKIKMIGAAILVPIIYLIFFMLMKYAN